MKCKLIKKTFSGFKFFIKHWPLVLAFLIFGLLLAKNPFSERTLIPNFEPYPDTFYYITTPRCWLKGEGWKLCHTEASGTPSTVSPLYAISLLPFLAIKDDPRIFYFGNLTFVFLGLAFFYLILRKILDPKQKSAQYKLRNQFLIFFLLFLYSTSYHLYWYPTLAMASNLLLPLFIIGLYLLTLPVTLINIALALILGISFVGAKFSAIPLTLSYLFIYLIKIIFKYKNNKKLLFKILFSMGAFLFLFSALTNFFLIKQIFQTAYNILFVNTQEDWFAFYHFPKNLNIYLNAFLGKPIKVLWDVRSFYPIWLGLGSMIGYFWAFFKKKILAFNVILLATSQIIFMSFFYDFDGRYVFIIFPVAFIGFAYFLKFGQNIFGKIYKKNKFISGKNIFILFTIFSLSLYCLNNFVRLKSQVSLNLKYAEQPWYYLSILEFNKFFIEKNDSERNILISALPPFLIDFYSNGNYSLLPLSQLQEFRNRKEAVWGENNYSNLIELYKQKISGNYQVYVTNYGIGNVGYNQQSFKDVEENFTLEKVHSGCHDQCNIYIIEL